ncbi:MAG: F0F1 ATP synthase subunit B [Bacteroidales bacterium]|jgi:F-type H+-transporting ATPase subunit b|nr:F0F1 ATP synthase subunit B [Bacteroidales bacterium]HHV40718.1 F0F1 ATP synthase subunit B [Bacteroidales bacterium]
MDLMIPDSGLLFWMLIAFGILFFILARFGWPAITGMVERRNEGIDKALSDAAAARQLLASLKLQEERILQQSREEQEKLIEQTTDLRKQLIEEAKEAAEKESKVILDRTREQLRIEKEAALQEIRLQVATLSVEIAEKLLRQQLESRDKQRELMDRLVEESFQLYE